MTALFSIFKLLLKIAAAPVVAILALFVWFCTWLVCVSGAVLGLVSLVLCVCAVLLFLSSSVTGGIIYLILAFFGKSFWAAYRRVMVAGQDSRTSVSDSGKCL